MSILPQSMQGAGQALQAASPLLMSMSQGLMSGQGAFANVGTGLAAMMQQQEQREREQQRERDQGMLASVLGGGQGGMAGMSSSQPSTPPFFASGSPQSQPSQPMASQQGGDRAGQIMQGLMQRGLPEHVARGFVMNFRDESRLDPSINEIEPLVEGSRGGFGLSQWTGPRRRQLEAFAAERGTPVDDIDTQLDFLMTELGGSERAAAERIMATSTPGEAAAAIVNDFLRPAEGHRAQREARYLGGVQPRSQPQRPQIDPQRLASIMQSPHIDSAMKRYVMQQYGPQAPLSPLQQQQYRMNEMRMAQMSEPQQPDPTSAMRNYEYLIQQGVPQDQAIERSFGGGGTSVTVNNNEGGSPMPGLSKLGEGMTYRYTPEGQPMLDERGVPIAVPIPGTSEAQSREAAATAAENAQEQRQQQGDVVLTDIGRLRGMLEGGRQQPITGPAGVIGARVPGSEASDARALADTIGANIGFDYLQAMRDASPTGGALGQVTERELQLLRATAGNIEFSQSRDQLMENLRRLEDRYADIVHGEGNWSREDGGQIRVGRSSATGQGDIPPPPDNTWTQDEWAEIWSGMPEADRELFR